MLILAALLPVLFWSRGPETGGALKKAGFTSIVVPPNLLRRWQISGTGIQAEALDPAELLSNTRTTGPGSSAPPKGQTSCLAEWRGAAVPCALIKLSKPSVNLRLGYASATREPWVDSNGWRILRTPNARFLYDAPGASAALAAAEAYTYGAAAAIQTDDAGLEPLGRMLRVLQAAGESDLPPEFNFEYADDGSASSAEFMNLLVRGNLLFKLVPRIEPGRVLQVALGQPDFPKSDAGNPKLLAEKVRAKVTDEKRRLRIYGSYVVIGRLLGNDARARLFLLNYGAEKASVDGIRVRVLGEYAKPKEWQYDCPNAQLSDYTSQADVTEFTVAKLPMFAVIDLAR